MHTEIEVRKSIDIRMDGYRFNKKCGRHKKKDIRRARKKAHKENNVG